MISTLCSSPYFCSPVWFTPPAQTLVLKWNASISSGVAGCNIYYGTTSGVYTKKINPGNRTSVPVSNLVNGVNTPRFLSVGPTNFQKR